MPPRAQKQSPMQILPIARLRDVASRLLILAAAIVTALSAPLVTDVSAAPHSAPAPPVCAARYGVRFRFPPSLLTADFAAPPRNDPREEGVIPYARWYVRESYPPEPDRITVAWGPLARVYPRPTVPAGLDAVAWRRERVVAAAVRLIGFAYQHHHIPSFDPGPDWPWLPVAAARNGKGLDCSNFTSFCYSFGLGVKPPTAIGRQAAMTRVDDLEVERLPVEPSLPNAPVALSALRKTLAPGDLLFIRNRARTRVSHVVMWVGALGTGSPDPLVIDSHGQDMTDPDGCVIAPGVRLRPFREGGWYHTCFDHALRLIR